MGGSRSAGVRVAITALRRGRKALTELDGQLDEALDWLHDPTSELDTSLPERMAGSARRASEALASIPYIGDYPAHALY
jgi:hypothetical protein